MMSDVHTVMLRLDTEFKARASFGSVPGAPGVLLDEPPPLGAGSGPNALDLLAAAIGNCLAASLMFCLQKSHADVSAIEATVTTHTARNAANRLRVDHVGVQLRLVGATDPAKVARCSGRFEDFCTVTASVRDGIRVDVSVTS